MVTLLLDKGADFNIKSADGLALWSLVVRKGHIEERHTAVTNLLYEHM